MIVYIKMPKGYKLLELVGQFTKVNEYKINISIKFFILQTQIFRPRKVPKSKETLSKLGKSVTLARCSKFFFNVYISNEALA